MAYRVVQWNTGNVGTQTLKAILQHPDLELAGCFAWSEAKAGVDAGELVGEAPVGVVATRDVDALLELGADCVCYTPLWPDLDTLCRILASGTNVTTTAAFLTGHGSFGEAGRARLRQACEQGQTSIMGTGMHPGFSNLMALATAGACNRIDKITITESQDASGYASAETQRSVGFDDPIDSPHLTAKVREGSLVFSDGLYVMAEALGITLDAVDFEARFAPATADSDLGFMVIRKGHVAGVEGRWLGKLGGRTVFDVGFRWKMGAHVEEPWPIEHAYLLEVQGSPTLKLRMEIRPPRDFVARSPDDWMSLGMIITGLPAVHAIPAVCEAPAGLRSYADLPLVTAKGCVAG
ncbi:MAG: dihydrodipicolinate reductase [Myxococcota bacterium]